MIDFIFQKNIFQTRRSCIAVFCAVFLLAFLPTQVFAGIAPGNGNGNNAGNNAQCNNNNNTNNGAGNGNICSNIPVCNNANGNGNGNGQNNNQQNCCLPGLPCIVDATENDPDVADDGPTAPGSPNQPNVTNGDPCDGANPAQGCACDADLMNQIYANAFLQSQRDVIKSEVLIRKPDSILEYTCFDQIADHYVQNAPLIFSESTRWHPTTVPIDSVVGPGKIVDNTINSVSIDVYMGPDRLRDHIQVLVKDVLPEYIDGHFSHTFLGGSAQSLDYAAGGGGGYNCSYMDQVYHLAKCTDIVTDDRFWRFTELIGNDPRLLPDACQNGTQITQELIDLSENKDFQYANIDKVDPSYVNLTKTGNNTDPCADPIPTGLMVDDKEFSRDAQGNVTLDSNTPFEDKFCPNPGCFYDKDTSTCKP